MSTSSWSSGSRSSTCSRIKAVRLAAGGLDGGDHGRILFRWHSSNLAGLSQALPREHHWWKYMQCHHRHLKNNSTRYSKIEVRLHFCDYGQRHMWSEFAKGKDAESDLFVCLFSNWCPSLPEVGQAYIHSVFCPNVENSSCKNAEKVCRLLSFKRWGFCDWQNSVRLFFVQRSFGERQWEIFSRGGVV